MTSDERSKLWPLLFWGSKLEHRDSKGRLADPVGLLAELFVSALIGKHVNRQPQQCVNKSIPPVDRAELAAALACGTVLESYLGWADCRICGAKLGSQDLTGWGFIWPQKAEHYITEHDVWTPECDRFLVAIRTT